LRSPELYFDRWDPDLGEEHTPEVRWHSPAEAGRSCPQREPADQAGFRMMADPLERCLHPDELRAYYLGDRSYVLPESAFSTLADIGRFRMVKERDLAEIAYAREIKRVNRDIRTLIQHELISREPTAIGRKENEILALTRKGKSLVLSSGRLPQDQKIYSGLAKLRETEHDAALYRMYQNEVRKIESRGGRPVRVLLDSELRRNLYRKLARLSPSEQTSAAREQVAAAEGLHVVHGRIQIPDLRVEYLNAASEWRQLDLELANPNYRSSTLAEKIEAGFVIYAALRAPG
jgi:hypothetical protein